MTSESVQISPFPTHLSKLVERITYRPGWAVALHGNYVRDPATTHTGESRGLTLVITTNTINSYPPHGRIAVNHIFAVPPSTWNRANWMRWLFDRFADVELHECMEFFTVDGVKPYAPLHGPGENPYTVREIATDEQRRTSFRGEVSQPKTVEHRRLEGNTCVCGAVLDRDGNCTGYPDYEIVRESIDDALENDRCGLCGSVNHFREDCPEAKR